MANRDEETYGVGEAIGGCFVVAMILVWIVLLCYDFSYFVSAAAEALSRFHWV